MSFIGEYNLETPENVQVSFELAGPGSRFCAVMIDTLLLWLTVFVLAIVATIAFGLRWDYLFRGRESADSHVWLTWINALLILVIMLVIFGYYTFFELVMHGRTPGKRNQKLRVIRDDGTPAAPLDIVIRNLVRTVDLLPGFYAVGGLACLLSATNKRLGDMAAGTIVIKDAELDYRATSDRKYEMPSQELRVTNPALSPEEQRLIRGFLLRRVELLPNARRQLAERLAAKLIEVHGGHLDDPESYLERLAEGRPFEH